MCPQLTGFTSPCYYGDITHISRRDPEGFPDLAVKFPHVAEAFDAPGWTPVGQLRVEDQPRPKAGGRRGEAWGHRPQGGPLPGAAGPHAIHPRHVKARPNRLRLLVLHKRRRLLPPTQTQWHRSAVHVRSSGAKPSSVASQAPLGAGLGMPLSAGAVAGAWMPARTSHGSTSRRRER